MPGCAVACCKNYNRNTKGTDIKYFSFPKNEELAKKWLAACKRKDNVNLRNACVCSVHFKESDYEISLKQRLLGYVPKTSRILKRDAVPTLCLPCSKPEKVQNRSSRLSKKRTHEEVYNILLATSSTESDRNKRMKDVQQDQPGPSSTELGKELESKPTLSTELEQLKQRIEVLELENQLLTQKVDEVKTAAVKPYETALARVFTPGQIKKVLNPTRQIRWVLEDIAAAISLRSVSPKAYKYLRANNYPLPALSTLRAWVTYFNFQPGILRTVLTLMKQKTSDFTKVDKLCVLTFNEIYISNKIDIDKKYQQVVGPHKQCQTVMLRGIIRNWKQPIYYQFDTAMLENILMQIIGELFNIGLIVVAMDCDMGTSNTNLWKKLDIAYDKQCCFIHPFDESLKVFVFADAPHLIKLSRNHLLDSGFDIDGHIINKDYLEALLNISSSELTLAHKLTQQHLQVKGSMRQRVRLAMHVFSNTVSKAMLYAGAHGLMPKNSNWKKAAEIVKLFNDWFDLFNSRTKLQANCPTMDAFGTDLNVQMDILEKMSQFITEIRVGNHKSLIPFQKGILLNNKSLPELYKYVNEKYNVQYILTARLNQDVLKNFFAYIRRMGGSNDHPSPLDFKYRLRWYILGKHSAAIFTENRNTRETDEACLVEIRKVDRITNTDDDYQPTDTCLTQEMLSKLLETKEDLSSSSSTFEDSTSIEIETIESTFIELDSVDEDMIHSTDIAEVKEKISREALQYIAGYVAYKFRHKYSLGIPTKHLDTKKAPDWLDIISRGSLLTPTDELLEAAEIMEAEFFKLHGASLSKEPKIFDQLANTTFNLLKNKVPFEVVLCMARTRIYIRLRDLNRKISFKNCKRNLEKKMSKFTNLKKQL